MEHTFNARIYQVDSAFFEGELTSVVVPAIDGEYGVLAHHRNVVIAIVPGTLRYTLPDGKTENVVVSEGMMRVENNDVLILVNKKTVFAHKTHKVCSFYQKSSYLCIVERHKG